MSHAGTNTHKVEENGRGRSDFRRNEEIISINLWEKLMRVDKDLCCSILWLKVAI